MNPDDSPEDFFRWNAEKAEDGSTSHAKEMLHGFCEYHQRGDPIPKAILEFLYQGFSRYLGGESIDLAKALKLIPPAHRPKGSSLVNPIPILANYYLLIKQDGLSKGQAQQRIIEKYPIAKRNLERAAAEWNLMKDFSQEELTLLAKLPLKSANNDD